MLGVECNAGARSCMQLKKEEWQSINVRVLGYSKYRVARVEAGSPLPD
jgi:hypothetical protein